MKRMRPCSSMVDELATHDQIASGRRRERRNLVHVSPCLDSHGSSICEGNREFATLVIDLSGLRDGTDDLSRVLGVFLHFLIPWMKGGCDAEASFKFFGSWCKLSYNNYIVNSLFYEDDFVLLAEEGKLYTQMLLYIYQTE